MTTTAPEPTRQITKADRIEERIDRGVADEIMISKGAGGLRFEKAAEIMEFAKMMSIAGQAIPPHLRTNVGACMAIAIQAVEWRMSPFAVANKSYVVNDRLCFESQLIHAVIEQRAPLLGRLRHAFAGEGDNRTCTVSGVAKGESEPLSYTSPPIGKIQPKNSPLWKTKPDLQLYYNTSRDWARMYFPDVIMGVYSEDEMKDSPFETDQPTLSDLPTRGSIDLNPKRKRIAAEVAVAANEKYALAEPAADEQPEQPPSVQEADAPHEDEPAQTAPEPEPTKEELIEKRIGIIEGVIQEQTGETDSEILMSFARTWLVTNNIMVRDLHKANVWKAAEKLLASADFTHLVPAKK